MLTVEVKVPDTYRLATAPAAVDRCIGRTPLTDTPLLGRWYKAEVLLEDPLVEIGHLLVLVFGQLIGLD